MTINHLYKKICAEAAATFCGKGLTPAGDSGDVSVRDPSTGAVYIWPRPRDGFAIPGWRVLKPENICVVDAGGRLLEDAGFLPTVELPMHLAIYRARPEACAIVHGHTLYSSAFAATGKNIPAALAESAAFLGGEIICARYAPYGSKELAGNIVEALGRDKWGALMQNHGTVVLGTDLDDAFSRSDYLEHAAHIAILGSVLGPVLQVDMDNLADPSLL